MYPKLTFLNSYLCWSSSPLLWKPIIERDYFLDNNVSNSKEGYINLFKLLMERISRGRIEKLLFKIDQQRQLRIRKLQIFLDTTQLRIMAILPPLSFFLTVLMLSLKFDGLNIQGWVCFIPIMFLLFYVIVSVGVASLIFKHQFIPDSIFRGYKVII